MNSTSHLSSSASSREEANQGFIIIKKEPESLIEEVFIYNNSNFSGSDDKSKASYTSKIKPDTTVRWLLNGVKCENEHEAENRKKIILKEEIEVKHIDIKRGSFVISGEGRKIDENGESTEDSEEKLKIIIKSEADLCEVSNWNCYDESRTHTPTSTKKINAYTYAQNIEGQCNAKDTQDIIHEGNELLQHCIKEEEITIKHEDLDVVKDEIVEGE